MTHCRTCTCTLGRYYDLTVTSDGVIVVPADGKPVLVTADRSIADHHRAATWHAAGNGRHEMRLPDGRVTASVTEIVMPARNESEGTA